MLGTVESYSLQCEKIWQFLLKVLQYSPPTSILFEMRLCQSSHKCGIFPLLLYSGIAVECIRIDLKRPGLLVLLFKYFVQMRPFWISQQICQLNENAEMSQIQINRNVHLTYDKYEYCFMLLSFGMVCDIAIDNPYKKSI